MARTRLQGSLKFDEILETVEGSPRAAQLHELAPPLQNPRQGRLLNDPEKTLPQDDLNHSGDAFPSEEAGAGQGGTKGPHWNAKGNPHHNPLVPQVNDCVSLGKWRLEITGQDPGVQE